MKSTTWFSQRARLSFFLYVVKLSLAQAFIETGLLEPVTNRMA